MTTQPDLFRPMCATTTAIQGDLFPSHPSTGRACAECGAGLVVTESGYYCCPAGHGRLIHPVCGACGEPLGWCEEWQEYFACPCRAGH